MARRWLLRADRQGVTSNIDVNSTIKEGQKLVEFEAKQKLSSRGMKQQDRWDRYLVSKIEPEFKDESKSVLQFFKNGIENPPTPGANPSRAMKKLPELAQRAQQGSKTAQMFFTAMSMLEQAKAHLQSNKFRDAFLTLRAALRTWDLLPMTKHEWSAYHEAAKRAFDANPSDAEALYLILRYQMLTNFHFQDGLQMAKKCISLDPKVADFHHFSGSLHGFEGDFESSFRYDRN
jgi:hypothetical protein